MRAVKFAFQSIIKMHRTLFVVTAHTQIDLMMHALSRLYINYMHAKTSKLEIEILCMFICTHVHDTFF